MIDRVETLDEFLPQLRAAAWVAVDTEADSLHSYPERLCLLQISVPGADRLVDTLAGLELAGLVSALGSRELILHGADYDLRLMRRDLGFVPETVFDTMWAARLLGQEQFGLGNLVQHYLGVALEKGSQKADWSRRPLTPRMETYARNDTRYLQPLAERLRAELEAKRRLDWLRECCARLIVESTTPREPDPDGVWRLGGSQKLDPRGLAVLRELWHWREAEARACRRPPFFVLAHDRMISIAAAAAQGQGFETLLPVRYSPIRRRHAVSAVRKGMSLAPPRLPHRLHFQGRRLTEGQKRELDRLRHLRDRRARELGLDPTLIASRATLLDLAHRPEAAFRELMTWQRELLAR